MYCDGGGGSGGADTTIASTRGGQGDDGAGPAQARQGQCNVGITTEVTTDRERGNMARQGRPSMINAGRSKRV